MYTIKRAAAKSGLTVSTLRAWERRYGIVDPVRTDAGYRLYDDDAVARLIAMRQLVDGHGLRPSQAADQMRSPETDVGSLVAESTLLATPVSGGRSTSSDVESFVEAATRLDVERMDSILDEWFAGGRFEVVMEHAVFPALRDIGAAWSSGRVDPSMEHAASETIRRRVAHFFDAAGSNDSGRPIVVGLPPGGHHDIGALAFGTALRRSAHHVLYLGADVPLESWTTAVRTTRAPIAVVGAVSTPDVEQARRVVTALRGLDGPPSVAVGGSHAGEAAAGMAATILPGRLDDAVEAVRDLAGGDRRSRSRPIPAGRSARRRNGAR